MYLNNQIVMMVIGVELTFTSLDSNNKYIFKQSTCVDDHWCRIENILVPI